MLSRFIAKKPKKWFTGLITRYIEDWQAAFRLAHTLKSSSASVGAYALSEIAKQIESLIRQQQSQQACALVQILQTEYQQVMSELVAMIHS